MMRARPNSEITGRVFSSFSILPSRTRITRWACKRDVRLVRHENNCVAALVQPRKKRHDFVAGGGVEVSRRLVGQQDGRMIHQRTRNGYALALPAGKFVRLVHHPVGKIHLRERFFARSSRSAVGVPL